MSKVSIAIPTFNSSKYVEELLSSLFNTSNKYSFNEIVINDDNSESDDFKNLINTVNYFSNKFTEISFELSQNKKNLGGFINKYNTVKKCNNMIIYQIDSDNIIKKSALKMLSEDNLEKPFLYLPSSISIFKDNKFRKRKIKFTKKFGEFSKEEIKTFLIKNNNVNKRDLNWVMNIGNPIFYKESYLEKLEEGINSKLNLSADAYGLTYFWLKNNGKLYLDKKHSHKHRLHDKSYWVTEGNDAVDSVKTFRELMVNL